VINTALTNPDFITYAESFGLWAERVTETDQFAAAFQRARSAGRPALLELGRRPRCMGPKLSSRPTHRDSRYYFARLGGGCCSRWKCDLPAVWASPNCAVASWASPRQGVVQERPRRNDPLRGSRRRHRIARRDRHGAQETVEAVTDCEASLLNVAVVRRLASTDVRLAWVLTQKLAHIVFDVVELLSDDLFDTVQQRVSRHLIDLAATSPQGLIVRVDQLELADSIGSVREVVARELKKLRAASLIERHPSGIKIVTICDNFRVVRTYELWATRPSSQLRGHFNGRADRI
jgi:hypothetical protein